MVMRFQISNKVNNQKLKDLLTSYPKAIEELKQQICNLQEENEKLQRIIEHYIPGKITGYSVYCIGNIWNRNWYDYLYVYKNGKEYKFTDLHINSPEFEQDSKLDNIIYAMSGDGNQHYVLDLDTLKWIKYADYSEEKERYIRKLIQTN